MPTSVPELRDRLRDEILDGDLRPDAVMTQTELADHLGVSRTPLREVLRMLELENLIVRESNGRFRISSMSIDEMEELTVMRISLETLAVRLTVPGLTAVDQANLEGLLAQMEHFAQVGDWKTIETPHRAFHQQLIAGAGDRITDLLGTLWDRAARYRRPGFRNLKRAPDRWEAPREEHRAIVDAVEQGDGELAAALTARQIGRTALYIAHSLDPDHPATKVRAALRIHAGTDQV